MNSEQRIIFNFDIQYSKKRIYIERKRERRRARSREKGKV